MFLSPLWSGATTTVARLRAGLNSPAKFLSAPKTLRSGGDTRRRAPGLTAQLAANYPGHAQQPAAQQDQRARLRRDLAVTKAGIVDGEVVSELACLIVERQRGDDDGADVGAGQVTDADKRIVTSLREEAVAPVIQVP